MRLEQYRTLWGNIDIFDGLLAESPHHDIETLIPHLASLGYDGIEMPFKLALFIGPDQLKGLLLQYNMRLTLSIYTDSSFNAGSPELDWWGGSHPNFTPPTTALEMANALAQRTEQHNVTNTHQNYDATYEALEEQQPDALLKILKRHLTCFKEEAAACYDLFGDRRKGGLLTLIVAHDLRDNFPWVLAAQYFRDILTWEKDNDFVVAHETHRKRFLYSPWAIRDFFLKYPDIRDQIQLCADYSHLLCVAEVDTSDPALNQVIDFLAPNVIHTQCRVGYDHGPQVSDPRSPEWIHYVEGMASWWDKIWQSQLERNCEYTTMIAEHGPPNYQMCVPGTKQPLANIWDVNHWIQLQRQKSFKRLFGSDHQTSRLMPSETQGYEPETGSND